MVKLVQVSAHLIRCLLSNLTTQLIEYYIVNGYYIKHYHVRDDNEYSMELLRFE